MKALIPLILSIIFISGCSISNIESSSDSALQQRNADRAEIHELVIRYVTALDTRDEDLYVSVWSEDAEYHIEGEIIKGHADLRAIVTGLKASREAAIAAGRPTLDLYHPLLNSSVTFINNNQATHEGYWQTVRRTDENFMRVGGMGRLYDDIVKVNGEWKIQKRVLTNFIERNF